MLNPGDSGDRERAESARINPRTEGPQSCVSDRLDELAAEFVAIYRRGETPDVAQFAAQNPGLAEQIRDLFPALLMMERVRPQPQDFARGINDSAFDEECKLDRLGDFRILREVGRGGMGIVYEAEQITLGRHVALKVLPKHAMLDSRYLRRFQNEARAAARLHHTNIVPVFGIGEHEGLHYYVMQFIQGIALDAVLDELRAIRQLGQHKTVRPHDATLSRRTGELSAVTLAEKLFDSPPTPSPAASPPLSSNDDAMECGRGEQRQANEFEGPNSGQSRASDNRNTSFASQTRPEKGSNPDIISEHRERAYWKSVARLGCQIADALNYAHNQGILHRDIKPANLLLDLQGTVWVTDFGLARGSESEGLTRSGDIVGTMRYMAPERLEGKADVRSDIYSLGVTLYEMLTLAVPHQAEDRAQLMRQIVDGTPQRPRSVDHRIPVDLETVVLKAISKPPGDRYQQASALAADLRRFVEDRPIQARRVSSSERILRWCRRNPVLTSLAATVLLLAAGLLINAGIARAIRKERDMAVASQHRAETAEAQSQQMLARAIAAERETKILAHLAKAQSFRQSRMVGQRMLPLEEIRQAAALHPTAAIESELRNAALEALFRPDLINTRETALANQAVPQIDSGWTRYAVVDLLGSQTISVYALTSGDLVCRLPIPKLNIWHATTCFTPDGDYLVVTYSQRNQDSEIVNVWDLQQQKMVIDQQIDCENVVCAVGVHPQGRWIVLPTMTRGLAVWDLIEAREVRRIPCEIDPFSIRFDRTGRFLLASSYDARLPIVVFEFDSGNPMFTDIDVKSQGDIAVSPTGRLIAFGGGDESQTGSIIIWDTLVNKVVSILDGHTSLITDLHFYQREDQLLSSSWDGSTRLWNVASGECSLSFPGRLVGVDTEHSKVAVHTLNALSISELFPGEGTEVLNIPGGGNRTSGVLGPNFVYTFDESGELALAGDLHGVRIWETARGTLIGELPIGLTSNILMSANRKSMITVGDVGIFCWPIVRSDEQGIVHWEFGPPKRLYPAVQVRNDCAVWLVGQRQLAFGIWGTDRVHVIDADPDDGVDYPPYHLPSDHFRIHNLTASSNGRWLASSGWKEQAIQVWDLENRTTAARLRHSDGVSDSTFSVQFSPDGRRLFCCAYNLDAPGLYIYETETWKRLHAIPGISSIAFTFSPNSELMTRQQWDQLILADGSNGEEIARLPSPWQMFVPHVFSRDGRSLLFLASRSNFGIIRLGRLQDLLSEMDLGWDLNFSPPHQESARRHKVVADCSSIVEELANIKKTREGNALADAARAANAAGNFALAIEKYQASIDLIPNHAGNLNNFAWLLVACPSSQYWDANRALELALRATELQSDSGTYLNTLGVAQYRSGLWRQAIATLKKAEERDPGTRFAFNGYFIAMAHRQLGETDEAKSWFQRSVEWMEQGRAEEKELIRFRHEASSLLEPKSIRNPQATDASR